MKKTDSGTIVAIAMMFTTIGITTIDNNLILGSVLMGLSLIILVVFLIKSIKSRINKIE